MAMTAKEAVLALPEEDRWELVAALLATLPKPVGVQSEDDPELDELLNRRLAEYESGKDPGIPADEFFQRLRQKRSKRS
jgi:putative addiction module component (TIGR02574 family)